MKTPLYLTVLGALALGIVSCAPTASTSASASTPVNVTVLGLNDFHGNLEPTSFSGVQVPDPRDATKTVALQAGGIDAIGGLLAEVRKENPNTIFVGGGDLIGASPVTSSLLRDEPSVLALGRLGMKASALGNHEFDQGLKELQRMQNGGCDSNAADKACKFEANYPGASFKWLGANVVFKNGGQNPFLPYYVETVGGAKIGFIGAVLKDTPTIVSPDGVADLNFLDEAESINKYVPILKAQGVDAILVLIHQGGETTDKYDTVGCKTLTGPIVDIAKKVDPAVAAIISGHTHQGYNCLVPDPTGKDRVVIEGDFYGHLLQRVDLQVDTTAHRVLQVKAQNVVVNYADRKAKGTLDANMTQLVAKAQGLTDTIKKQPIGTIAAAQIRRAATRTEESALGGVIADSQLAATKAQGAVIAFMNPGGIRADLPGAPGTPGGTITFGDAFAVQPFGNTLTVLDLTGAQIKALLEQQFTGNNSGTNVKLLQVSAGFAYKYESTKPDGQRVSDITLNGQPLVPTQKYRVVANSFLAAGGDNFTVFKDGTNVVQLPNLVDVDAFSAYLKSNGATLDGKLQGRITKLN